MTHWRNGTLCKLLDQEFDRLLATGRTRSPTFELIGCEHLNNRRQPFGIYLRATHSLGRCIPGHVWCNDSLLITRFAADENCR